MPGTSDRSADWVGNLGISALAWWLPHGALLAGFFVAAGARAAIWGVALAVMGAACILNARRCGRTHCRFTGPFYLLMIVPVAAFGFGALNAGLREWLALGALIIIGGMTIWFASERAWGKFS